MVDPEHVLHVEDSDADAELVGHLLKSYPYRVTRVRTYSEMMDFRGHPDVILLDLRIPGSDSPLRLVSDAVRRFRTAGVILLTGIGDRDGEELSVKAMAAGAQIRLVKGTFDSRRLWLSIREAYQQRQHLIRTIEESRADMRVEPSALRDTIRGVLDKDLYGRLREIRDIENITDKRLTDLQNATNRALDKLRKLGAEDTQPIQITVGDEKFDLIAWFRNLAKHEKAFRWLFLIAAGAYFAVSDYVTGIHDAIIETPKRLQSIDERLTEIEKKTEPREP
jgi:CheY-like chemotaxis protein